MTAVRWFSIVFTLLLVRHSTALSISNEEPYTSIKNSEVSYDFVDVAQQQHDSFLSDTGTTTRFFTNGDVDEAFWLRQLGDDFKNAIHLQVGDGERCDNENGSNYEIEHEPPSSSVQENELILPTINEKKVEEKSSKKSKVNSNESKGRSRRKPQTEQRAEKSAGIIENVKNITPPGKDHIQLSNTSDQNTVSNEENYNERSNKFQDISESKKHFNLKYVQKARETDTKTSTSQDTTTLADAKSKFEETPVFINLPESKNVIELDTNDEPVVVQMPPVIYHSERTAFADQNDYTDNTQTHLQTNTQSTEEQTHYADERDTDSNQYTQHPYITHEQQQQYIQYLQHTNSEQQQQTQYPVQIQEANESPYFSSSSHHNRGVDPSSISSIPIHQPNMLQSDIDKLRYMLSKRSVATESPEADNESSTTSQCQPDSSELNKSRVSRSIRELYQEGL